MASWTFGKKIGAGFALALVLLVLIGGVSYRSVGSLTKTSYWVAHTHLVREHVSSALAQLVDAETGQRGFVITGDEAYLDNYTRGSTELTKTLRELRELVADNPTQQQRLNELEPIMKSRLGIMQHMIEVRRANGFEPAKTAIQGNEGRRVMMEIRRLVEQMDQDERELLKQRAADVENAYQSATMTVLAGTAIALLLVFLVGLSITRSLSSQIGSAVKNVHTSSSELQAAASQQVTGSKEQSTAMTEITTTINELLATSRQIAESAQRVAQMAAQASTSARAGDQTMQRTQESVASIRRQVDSIVTHMLELGKKSQQIGAILEIINELAEQTNILAINATIEAAGAGESGKRFGVVADEIRKLADRVGGSTKDIRKLVDDIRTAVNTTVMATETGSKAVDTGARQFGDVATAFSQIVGLVATTQEAAREIELSTKQQSTAVEQVNIAVANVSQAARETETSSTQTLQTSAQLTTLARELSKLVQAEATA